MTVPISLEEVVQLLDGSKLISYFLVSSAVLFLYDWMLLLPVELEVVWSEKLQPSNVLYIIQRYMPFVDTIGLLFAVDFVQPIEPNTCRILYNTSAWMYLIGIALTEVVLTMRTCALWGKDIKLTIGLAIFFVACWILDAYIVHLFLDSQAYIPSPILRIGCVIVGGKPILSVGWVIVMVYEAMILTLTLIPGVAFFPASYTFRSGSWSALTTVVYRDGITYYLLLFGLSLANLLTVLLLPVSFYILSLVPSTHPLAQHNLQNLFIPYQRVMHTLLTSRVILHIRSQSRKPPTTSTLVVDATCL
ncbi:hypothetical protein BDP27DRAFT_1510470 [Rhodocollybia butyracea]|uniref:DUF6533 domain-containing protein n=1 Tax=Rhodocollybia butyracea TaxID=206335 RepID=A0A9P5PYS8_9AGAR|nr:hypothetical protein BDP27DRAFT_1510470 [Rhodocollybia butyracea]